MNGGSCAIRMANNTKPTVKATQEFFKANQCDTLQRLNHSCDQTQPFTWWEWTWSCGIGSAGSATEEESRAGDAVCGEVTEQVGEEEGNICHVQHHWSWGRSSVAMAVVSFQIMELLHAAEKIKKNTIKQKNGAMFQIFTHLTVFGTAGNNWAQSVGFIFFFLLS